ncbi:unnamed protein product, partial [Larinioides sclopetarius]
IFPQILLSTFLSVIILFSKLRTIWLEWKQMIFYPILAGLSGKKILNVHNILFHFSFKTTRCIF